MSIRPPPRLLLAGAILFTLTAAGCATAPGRGNAAVPAYVSPSGGNLARLAIRGHVRDGQRFGVFVLRDNELCRNFEKVGVSEGSGSSLPTITLATDSVTTLDYVVDKGEKTLCFSRWSFTPMAGHSYAFIGESRSAAPDCSGMSALIYETAEGKEPVPLGSALRRNVQGNECVALNRARSVAEAERESEANLASNTRDRTGAAVLNANARSDDLKGLIK